MIYTTFEDMEQQSLVRGRVLETLEFHKIKSKLCKEARSIYGKEVCEYLVPCGDIAIVERWQSETEGALQFIQKKGGMPVLGIPDIRPAMDRVRAGGTLSPKELLEIGSFLRSIKTLISYGETDDSKLRENIVSITANDLFFPEFTEAEIRRCIVSDEEIHERASEDLFQISRKIKEAQENIRTILNRILRNHSEALQEQLITIRGDRFVVPVKADRRSEISGVVHDMSATGQTIFVEPMSVVEHNNSIRELESRKKEEIDRILRALSNLVDDSQAELKSDWQIVGQLDFMQAKASLALKMEASRPILNQDGVIELRKARHPLISSDHVVPIDFSIGENYRTLVITGPNTGGKTVSLKTCGLLTLMAQAGLQIPCLDHSRISIFKRVLADIGDEQSIEQSLSTFSSHMKNLIFIMSKVRENSLVLVDELGSGTDPSEGAALAMAILEELRQKGAVAVATTHYKELKSYAVETDQVENACCEFDTETLSPTYRLLIGMPGVSNAFQISKKLGLPERIINQARSLLSKEGLQVEELLASAERTNRDSERQKAEIRQIRSYVKKQEEELSQEKEKLEKRKQSILDQAQREKKELLENTFEQVQEMIDEVRSVIESENKEAALERMHQIRSNLRAGISDLEEPLTKKTEEVAWGEKPVEIMIGEKYEAPSFGASGTVVKGPDTKGNYILESGALRFTVSKKDLFLQRKESVTNKKSKKSARLETAQKLNQRQKISKAMSFLPELKLLGLTVDQAVIDLDRYLDDCILSNISEVRIVHGKGTGALRAAVTQHLRQDKRVKRFRLGTFGEGDDGVTIVEF